ncbi:MAG: DUF4352 domain-containing protein [Collinsella sp.]
MTGVRVTYSNNSDEALSFNSYDWKGESASGVQSDATYYSEAAEELSYGDLSAGGTVSGYVYFEGDLANVLYLSSPFADEPRGDMGHRVGRLRGQRSGPCRRADSPSALIPAGVPLADRPMV